MLMDAERSPPDRAAVLRSIFATSAVRIEPLPLPRHAVSPEAWAHNDAMRLSAVALFSECSAEIQGPYSGHRHTRPDIASGGGAGLTSTALACGQCISAGHVVSSVSGGRR